MTNKELGHRPVLIEEVIEQLGPKDNETYIDATFGYEDIQRESFKAANVKSLQSTEIQQSKNKLKDLKKSTAVGFLLYILNLVRLIKFPKKQKKKKLTVSYLI